MDVRPAAVAGRFYPGDPRVLHDEVQALLDAAAPATPPSASWPKALIVPHAGYIYSGATAARAYARLAPGRGTVRRIVLLGPVHRVPVRGLALPGAPAFSTPLGLVTVDAEAMRTVAQLPQVVVSPAAHAQEHSLEVQLPFLQTVLGDFTLLPLAVGDATTEEVAQVLDLLWGGPETVIVISSDLSHFHSYDKAKRMDHETVQAMLQGRPNLNHQQACGATPVNGLLAVTPRHGLVPELLGLCNSGDTAGDAARVVGYASIAFSPRPVSDALPPDAGKLLLPIARHAIAHALGEPGHAIVVPRWLQVHHASFVTLRQAGQLRGCIGTLEPRRSLLDDIKANAVAAALHDRRFTPLTAAELHDVTVEVSVLSKPEPMAVTSEEDALRQLRPGIDGLIFTCVPARATFLPQVWEQIPDARQFLAQLKRKAGVPADFWDQRVRLQRYTVEHWSEEDPA